ncbi:MAG TPA: hypothetical protein VFM54_23635 [Micromonosporaceae bacterium]|nr:hypothetical protein [Micromonosporaceae bacterium]
MDTRITWCFRWGEAGGYGFPYPGAEAAVLRDVDLLLGRHADRIVVLNGGRVAGTGTHGELVRGQPGLPGDRRRPGRRAAGRGMSTTRAVDLAGSGRRLLRTPRPQRTVTLAMLAAGTASVALSVLAPTLLGRVTDVVFAGVVGNRLPAGMTRAEAVEQQRGEGRDTFAGLVDGGRGWHQPHAQRYAGLD